jgi:2-iminoacetate synthase ThiH
LDNGVSFVNPSTGGLMPEQTHSIDAARRWRMLLYAPLYLSSHCINHCLYCHFRFPNKLQREHLERAAALAEAEALQRGGFRHVLLVAGDYPQLTSPHLKLAFSLPRIHDAPDDFAPPYPADDETLLRLYCSLRLAFPTAELVLSTRERPVLRDRLAAICITQMSAGSCTSPGGYTLAESEPRPLEQFPVADRRTAAAVAGGLRRAGFDVCWEIEEVHR